MQEILIALFAIFIGALFCFYGYKTMRVLLPLWGLVAGYYLGANLVYAVTGDTVFSTALSIGVGISFAVVFAVLAYLFYVVAVVVFMAAVGYWLGAGVLIALGVKAGMATVLLGLVVAAVFAAAVLLTDIPRYALLFLTAFFGAALVVSGLLVIGNVVDVAALKDGTVALLTNQSWVWQVLWLVVGAVGLWAQMIRSEQKTLNWQREWEVR